MELYLLLITETKKDKIYNIFDTIECLEEYLKNINLNDYMYKNLLVYIDDRIHFQLSKLYKNKYLI